MKSLRNICRVFGIVLAAALAFTGSASWLLHTYAQEEQDYAAQVEDVRAEDNTDGIISVAQGNDIVPDESAASEDAFGDQAEGSEDLIQEDAAAQDNVDENLPVSAETSDISETTDASNEAVEEPAADDEIAGTDTDWEDANEEPVISKGESVQACASADSWFVCSWVYLEDAHTQERIYSSKEESICITQEDQDIYLGEELFLYGMEPGTYTITIKLMDNATFTESSVITKQDIYYDSSDAENGKTVRVSFGKDIPEAYQNAGGYHVIATVEGSDDQGTALSKEDYPYQRPDWDLRNSYEVQELQVEAVLADADGTEGIEQTNHLQDLQGTVRYQGLKDGNTYMLTAQAVLEEAADAIDLENAIRIGDMEFVADKNRNEISLPFENPSAENLAQGTYAIIFSIEAKNSDKEIRVESSPVALILTPDAQEAEDTADDQEADAALVVAVSDTANILASVKGMSVMTNALDATSVEADGENPESGIIRTEDSDILNIQDEQSLDAQLSSQDDAPDVVAAQATISNESETSAEQASDDDITAFDTSSVSETASVTELASIRTVQNQPRVVTESVQAKSAAQILVPTVEELSNGAVTGKELLWHSVIEEEAAAASSAAAAKNNSPKASSVKKYSNPDIIYMDLNKTYGVTIIIRAIIVKHPVLEFGYYPTMDAAKNSSGNPADAANNGQETTPAVPQNEDAPQTPGGTPGQSQSSDSSDATNTPGNVPGQDSSIDPDSPTPADQPTDPASVSDSDPRNPSENADAPGTEDSSAEQPTSAEDSATTSSNYYSGGPGSVPTTGMLITDNVIYAGSSSGPGSNGTGPVVYSASQGPGGTSSGLVFVSSSGPPTLSDSSQSTTTAATPGSISGLTGSTTKTGTTVPGLTDTAITTRTIGSGILNPAVSGSQTKTSDSNSSLRVLSSGSNDSSTGSTLRVLNNASQGTGDTPAASNDGNTLRVLNNGASGSTNGPGSGTTVVSNVPGGTTQDPATEPASTIPGGNPAQTGDDSHVLLYLLVCAAALLFAAGGAWLLFRRRLLKK